MSQIKTVMVMLLLIVCFQNCGEEGLTTAAAFNSTNDGGGEDDPGGGGGGGGGEDPGGGGGGEDPGGGGSGGGTCTTSYIAIYKDADRDGVIAASDYAGELQPYSQFQDFDGTGSDFHVAVGEVANSLSFKVQTASGAGNLTCRLFIGDQGSTTLIGLSNLTLVNVFVSESTRTVRCHFETTSATSDFKFHSQDGSTFSVGQSAFVARFGCL